MAKEKSESKIVLERTYNVPLRKRTQKAPMYRRAKKAVNVLREFLAKHMKSDNVKIGKLINLKLWERGIKNPPHHIKVDVTKDAEGLVVAELSGVKKEKKVETKSKPKATPKKEAKPEGEIEKALDELEEKTGKIKVEKQEKAKVEEKTELDAIKKQPPETPKAVKHPPKVAANHPSDLDAKTNKVPRGGQKLEGHQGDGKQQKKE